MKPVATPASGEFLTSFGTIRGLVREQGGRRRILAVHGWLDNAASFTPISPLLDDASLVAIDLAGHGHSDHRAPGASYHLVDYVTDVVEVANRLGWSKFTLLGHSLGAGIAALAAAAFPERVERLCLVDGIGPISGHEEDCAIRLRRSIKMRTGKRELATQPYESIEAAVAARLKATAMQPRNARLIVERNLQESDGGFTWRTDRRVTYASPLYLSESQVRAFLGAIACPALLIVAQQGVIAGRDHTRARIACMPALQVCEMPGHHHLHMDDAPRVAERINGFFAGDDC